MDLYGALKRFRSADVSKRLSHFTSEDIAVLGVFIIGIFSALIIILDGYLFYTTVFKERERRAAAKGTPILSSSEIDEVIKILDERQKKTEEILRTR